MNSELILVETARSGPLKVSGDHADALTSRAGAANVVVTYHPLWGAFTAWCRDLGFSLLANDR